ncbi:MAG: bifunctional riboflavin kinase/FAD synthetase [Anaerococcus vaginalis]|uniref:bifunctional riboflavin kinase/FAD synthetase n=1 Tax=Anaerococcus TaxID=165779 RepID=UPI0008A60C43|nr:MULTISPECIES: bifunctional riboflavin kinase/FAD synthetase [Anaerococcus]MDU5086226.1 bifunctional riboflavin kinase/FAD synthetase [Anaerococcus vaginalis]OFL18064.1 riboflavin biosynthesis protein RibF [Anaerococcus sp. HMSC068A02]
MKDNIKIFDLDFNEFDLSPKAVSLGNFDGVHKGHQKLMKENIKISKAKNLTPSVLLFKENTKNILNGEREYLTSLEDKIEILKNLGIECFCLLEFSDKFKDLSPYEFIEEILYKKLNTKYVIVGDNYRFGKMAKGDIKTLKKYEEDFAYKTKVVDFELDEGKIINSTDIRQMVREGKIEKANKDLGHPFKMQGKVIKGAQRGRLLNFPTANLKPSFKYVTAKSGVYFTRVNIDRNIYYALTDIGTNPTFENKKMKIETYIMDFSKDIYGKNISIEFLEYLRPDYKFNSPEELIAQMEKDKKIGRKLIEKYRKE